MFGLWLALAAAVSELTGGSTVLWRPFASLRALKVGQALGAGFLLALGISELIPEGLEQNGSPLFTLAGFLLLMLVEGWLGHRHHGHEEETGTADDAGHTAAEAERSMRHEALGGVGAGGALGAGSPAPEAGAAGAASGRALRRTAAPSLAGPTAAAVATWGGAMVCAFSDGVSIASAGSAGVALGLLVFVGYLPHKMFEGFTISTVLAGAGIRRPHATLGAGLLGVSTLLGASLALVALRYVVGLGAALLLSAGIVLNLAASELIPELREGGDRRHLYLVPLGTAVYVITVSLLRAAGIG